jgi:hypothetical protein
VIRIRDHLVEFWRGATEPSLKALITAGLTNVALFAALCVYISPGLLVGPNHRYLMEDATDRSVPVSGKVFQSGELNSPRAIILGDSLIVQCVAGEQRLEQMLALKVGKAAPRVLDMSVEGQVSLEMAAIVDQVRPSSKDITVIGIGPGLLAHDKSELKDAVENPRLAFSSAVFDWEAKAIGLEVPHRRGMYVFDNWRFFLARRHHVVRNVLFTGPPQYDGSLDNSLSENIDRTEYWQQEIWALPWVARRYDANKHINLAIIDRIAQRVKTSGDGAVLLMEAPINPRWYDEATGREFFARYRRELHGFAVSRGLPVLSLSEEGGLRAGDFIDYEGHIGTHDGKERCTNAIASGIANLTRGHESSSRNRNRLSSGM